MDKEQKMKKKLFIGGAYLVVALLLLIYVSYSAYRIKIAAEVQMPEALEQKASLNFEYSQRNGKTENPTGIVLNDLKPNEIATASMTSGIVAAKTAGRALEFSISNADLVGDNHGTQDESRSRLSTKYKLRLIETGVVPLEVILVDEAGNTYSLKTQDEYQKREDTFRNADGTDAVFELPNDQIHTHSYQMYFGWNNDKGVYDGDDRKEIASVEIRADIVEDIPWMTESITEATLSSLVDGYYVDEEPTNATPAQLNPPS